MKKKGKTCNWTRFKPEDFKSISKIKLPDITASVSSPPGTSLSESIFNKMINGMWKQEYPGSSIDEPEKENKDTGGLKLWLKYHR